MYQAKSGVKNFSLYWGGPSTKNFFPSLNMYQAKSGVKNVSLYWGRGVPWQKIYFPVWTCIKPNLVSKIFPFTGGGGPSTKNLFPSLNMYQAKSGVKNFSLYLGGGSLDKNFFSSLNMYQAKSGVKNFSLYWDQVPPPKKIWDLGSPPKNLRPGTPPRKSETWDPSPPPKIWDLGPPPKVNRQTFPSINITFPRTTYAGGNKTEVLKRKGNAFGHFLRRKRVPKTRNAVLSLPICPFKWSLFLNANFANMFFFPVPHCVAGDTWNNILFAKCYIKLNHWQKKQKLKKKSHKT